MEEGVPSGPSKRISEEEVRRAVAKMKCIVQLTTKNEIWYLQGKVANSIQCTACRVWIHKRCSGVTGKLTGVVGYTSTRCVDGIPVDSVGMKEVFIGQNDKLECVEKLCYLGDMIGSGGGSEDAVREKVRCAWARFKELSPILTARGASLTVKGKIYRAVVQSVLIHGRETWPMKMDDMQRLERTERLMVRWMCRVSLKDRICEACWSSVRHVDLVDTASDS